jgi:hypothetical protein
MMKEGFRPETPECLWARNAKAAARPLNQATGIAPAVEHLQHHPNSAEAVEINLSRV